MTESNPILLGVQVSEIHPSPEFRLGTRVWLDGTLFEYIQAGGTALVAGEVYIIPSTKIVADKLSSSNDDGPVKLGVPQIAITASYYGWVAIQGNLNVKVLASCVQNVKLYSTATAGALDDASSSVALIPGLFILATVPASTTITAAHASIELYTAGA